MSLSSWDGQPRGAGRSTCVRRPGVGVQLRPHPPKLRPRSSRLSARKRVWGRSAEGPTAAPAAESRPAAQALLRGALCPELWCTAAPGRGRGLWRGAVLAPGLCDGCPLLGRYAAPQGRVSASAASPPAVCCRSCRCGFRGGGGRGREPGWGWNWPAGPFVGSGQERGWRWRQINGDSGCVPGASIFSALVVQPATPIGGRHPRLREQKPPACGHGEVGRPCPRGRPATGLPSGAPGGPPCPPIPRPAVPPPALSTRVSFLVPAASPAQPPGRGLAV